MASVPTYQVIETRRGDVTRII